MVTFYRYLSRFCLKNTFCILLHSGKPPKPQDLYDPNQMTLAESYLWISGNLNECVTDDEYDEERKTAFGNGKNNSSFWRFH